jgi:hypothetical protein
VQRKTSKQAAGGLLGNRQNPEPANPPAICQLDGPGQSASADHVLLFKRILDFKKTEGGFSDKRGAKRYPVGVKSALKAKLTLPSRDSDGGALPPETSSPMDWGGQLVNLSTSGASIRIHPAAIAKIGDACVLKIEIDNMLFELAASVAYFRITAQYVACGIELNFSDQYSRRAYLQLMEPVVIGSTFEAARAKQDIPGLIKEQYKAESDAILSVWRDSSGKNPKLFELQVHDFFLRGNTEIPGLKIGYRDGSASIKINARTGQPQPLAPGHQLEVKKLYQLIVQNLSKNIPSEVRKFMELFAD